MGHLRPAARRYIVTLVLVALAGTLGGLRYSPILDGRQALLLLAFAVLLAVVNLFPLHFAFKTKLSLDTSLLFAAILLFPPGTAMLVAGVGTLVGGVVGGRPRGERLFNAAQAVLRVGGAGLALAVAGWDVDRPHLSRPAQVLALVVAAGAMYLINHLAVALMVGFHTGQVPLRILRQTVGFDSVEQLAQVALGLLAAVLVDAQIWALPLLVLLGFIVHRSSQRHLQLRQQTLDAVEALADIVDLRDPYTAEHSQRVATCARELAIRLDLAPDEVEMVEQAARVHDVGKIVVDLAVLAKVGRPSDDEWAQLQRHPATGAQILSRFPQFARATSYVRHHHERLDGGGYPDGLRGEQIPLGARIIAVADSFDAMAAARPYRPGLPLDVVLAEFAKQRARQWDPHVVDALLELIAQGRIGAPHANADRQSIGPTVSALAPAYAPAAGPLPGKTGDASGPPVPTGAERESAATPSRTAAWQAGSTPSAV